MGYMGSTYCGLEELYVTEHLAITARYLQRVVLALPFEFAEKGSAATEVGLATWNRNAC